MMRALLVVLVAFLALAAGVMARSRQGETPPKVTTVDLAALSFPDLNGQSVRMDLWKGKILVVNFWATWCPPCLEEMPAFVKLQEEYANKGLQFVGIAIDDGDSVKDYLKVTPVNYPILIGENGGEDWAASLGNHAHVLPFSAVFDPAGKLLHVEVGAFDREEVIKAVEPLLKASAP